MWQQIAAIWWAQFRTSRNHLPRRTFGSILATCLSVLWYGSAMALGIILAFALPAIPLQQIAENLGLGLIGVFIFWQVGPLFTMSAGWSLQLNKLQIYPIPHRTLFLIEVFLRFTTAPEMIPVLLGTAIGLLRHRDLGGGWGLGILLFVPLNLFLALAVREVVMHSFERNRFREIFTVFLVSIGLLPQLFLRTSLGHRIEPYFAAVSSSPWTPWGETAHVALGTAPIWEWTLLLVWTLLFFTSARALFARSLLVEETLRAPVSTSAAAGRARRLSWTAKLFRDPLAALIEKELGSLFRMPRFRVSFGMACVFSVVVFIPLTFGINGGRNRFFTENFLEGVMLYGLLILSDTMMLNIFGTDRAAAQLYFVAPIDLRSVIRAKNIVAAVVVIAEAALVLLVVLLVRMPVSLGKLGSAVGSASVIGLFFMAVGNISSIMAARPVDPGQTFRKQAGTKIQLWLLSCSVGMFLLVGAAHLAQWAVGAPWAGLAVIAVELLVATIVYRIALDTAVERSRRDRETLISALSRNASPIGSGS